jgi:hypothetical protein
VQWIQENAALRVKIPAQINSNIGFTLKVELA